MRNSSLFFFLTLGFLSGLIFFLLLCPKIKGYAKKENPAMSDTASPQESLNKSSQDPEGRSRTRGFWMGQGFEDFPPLPTPGIDVEALMLSHRKNLDLVKKSQQVAADLVRELIQVSHQYVHQSFDAFKEKAYAPSKNKGKSPQGRAPSGPAHPEESFDQFMAYGRQITDLFTQSTARVFESYRNRLNESVHEFKSFAKV